MTNPADELLTIQELADLTGLSVSTARRRVQNGEIPADKLRGRTGAYVIRRGDIPRHLDPVARLQDYDVPSV